MTPEFINKMKERLSAELQKLKDSLDRVADPDKGDHIPGGDYAAKFPNYGDDHDSELLDNSPTEVQDYATNLAVTNTLEKRLRNIESALQRIADGSYGRCQKCGQEITEARLEANPEAQMCVQCAAKE